MSEPGKLYKQAKRLEGRNGAIYKAKLAGCTAAQIAEAFNMSEANVYVKLKQVAASITPDEKSELVKIAADFYDTLKQMCMDLALKDPVPAFAPNGKPQFDPITGEVVYDYSLRLNAIDRLLKVSEREAKLRGLDSAQQQTVQVTVEAQRATQEQADRLGKQFASVIPMSPEVAAHAARG